MAIHRTVIEKLDRVEEMLKHMPGRHDQQRHDPTKGAGGTYESFKGKLVGALREAGIESVKVSDRERTPGEYTLTVRAGNFGKKDAFHMEITYDTGSNRMWLDNIQLGEDLRGKGKSLGYVRAAVDSAKESGINLPITVHNPWTQKYWEHIIPKYFAEELTL